MDFPEEIKRRNGQVQDASDEAYDGFYDIVKDTDGSTSYTAFSIWGPGRTAKVQCDFNAMIGPGQFREFAVPMLERQCSFLDFSVFHLDGPDALCHAPALMEIRDLNALQWTPGAGKPDCGAEIWYDLYDIVREAGKALHLSVYDGDPQEMWTKCDALVKRYGPKGIYLLLPDMPEDTARAFVERADREWR